MAQIGQGNGDSNEWSRGDGEFYVASKTTTTNRKMEVISSQRGDSISYPTNDQFPDPDGVKKNYIANHSENDVERNDPNANITSAIHVDVQPSYGPIDVPIQARTQRSRYSLRQGSETYVVSKMNLPILASPTARNQQRSQSFDALQNSSRNQNTELVDSMRRTSLRDKPNTMSRNHSLPRRKSPRHRHHHCCYHHKCPPYRGKFYEPYTGTMQYPVAMQPAYPTCPLCQNSYAPTLRSNLNGVPATPVILQPYPVMASPAVPTHYSLPRRYYPQQTRGETSAWPLGTMSQYPPTFPRNTTGRKPRPPAHYPGDIHEFNQPQTAFPFDSDVELEKNSMRYAMSSKRRISKDILDTALSRNQVDQIRSQQGSRQMTATNGMTDASFIDTLGRKAQKTPYELVIPVTDPKDQTTPIEYSTTNELYKSYMSEKYSNTPQIPGWYPESDAKIHGEVTREDGFPLDYVDLIENTPDIIYGDEDTENPDVLQTPDKHQVIELVRRALETSIGSAQVATTLKMYMDEYFQPAWNVVAGTGGYASNITSINGQMLHFKAFGWAFLLWKTDQE